MTDTYDVSIIGAGIMGCSTAYQLAKRGLKVAVLEKSYIGAGSSGTSSAIIRQHYSNEVTARMALHSLSVFQNFKDEIGDDCGFTQTGFLALTTEGDIESLKANVALQQRIGIQTELIKRDEIQHRWPYLDLHDLVAGAYEAESGYADPTLTLNGYVQAARNLGVKFHQDTEVNGLRFSGGKVRGISSTIGNLDSPIVLNCAGPWGAHVAKMAEIDIPIHSCRVQVAFFRRPPEHESEHPVIADFCHAVYWRPETGRLTLVGLIDPAEAKAVVDPDDFNNTVGIDFIADAGERLVRRFPQMEQGESAGGFAALYAITPDWHPIIDELPEGSGSYICAGFSGHGFKLGPAVGRMTADLILGQTSEEMDSHLFRFSRFAENDPVRGRYEYSIVG